MNSSITESLNPEQLKAVTLPNVSSLILAGAGSGKTRVLTNRIAYLLDTRQAMPGEILAVTFTNKASKEMAQRLAKLIPFNIGAMWIGTFHALCNKMLRMYYQEAGLPRSFAILDMSDQLSTIKRVMKANQISDKEVPAKEIQRYINKMKEDGIRYSAAPDFPNPISKLKKHVYGLYEKVLFNEGSCDFAELLLRAYELLNKNEMIRRSFQERFRYILIDEFQDTNVLQYKWIKLLSGIEEPGANPNIVFAVGDDDQSIYAFRGANVGNMQDFVKDFRIRTPIKLEQNYRSHGNILNAANGLIKHNRDRMGKNLWTSAGEGEKIRVFEAFSDLDEAAFLVDTIKSMVNEDGVARKEIAILYRSNAQSRVIEAELNKRKIPYKVYGGLRFYDRAEVKHALAYMRLAQNTADDSAFLRVVNFPARGIGTKSVEALIDYAKQNNVSLYDAFFQIGGTAQTKLRPFINIIDALREEKMNLKLRDFIEFTIKASGLEEFYLNDKNGEERLENLRELVSAALFVVDENGYYDVAAGQETKDGPSPLEVFLAGASLDSGDTEDADADSVQLMTVHASKGLEFKNVFITGLEEGLFPHNNALKSFDDKDREEERRLLYVAITRAKENLYLTFAKQRMLNGAPRANIRSSFFREIPGETLKWLTPEKDSFDREESNWGWDDFTEQPRSRSGSSGGGYSSGSGYSSGGYERKRGFFKDVENTRSSKNYGAYEYSKFSEQYTTPKADKIKAAIIREKRDSDNPFQPGKRVFHEKFGQGVIIATEGIGEDHQMIVKFDSKSEKLRLLTKIARKKMSVL